jgi:hypothetical protein
MHPIYLAAFLSVPVDEPVSVYLLAAKTSAFLGQEVRKLV